MSASPPAGAVLSDGVVTLRPFALTDVETHLAGEDEEQVRWLSGGTSTRTSVTAWIERNLHSWTTDGPIYNFAVCSMAQHRPIGMIEANRRVCGFLPHVANVSYGLYPSARGRGYASRAVRLMVAYLSQRGDISTAVIQVDPENQRSARVAERAGFRSVGRRVSPDGHVFDTYVKSLVADP